MVEQNLLQDWSKETRDFYLNVVGEVGEDKAFSFYNQSKLTESLACKLMVIGYNPGAGCRFSEWKEKLLSYSENFLLNGNPCFWDKDDAFILKEYRDKWDIWCKIHRMLIWGDHGDILEDLRRFVFTNMVFFGSEKEKELDLLQHFSVECSKRTLALIPILRPDVVLLNGCGNLFEKAAEVKLESLFPQYNTVSFVKFNETLFLSIKHTAYRYTNEEMELIGKTLGYALDHPEDFCPEQVRVVFASEIQKCFNRIRQQKESAAQNKATRREKAESILKAVKNKFPSEELAKGKGRNKSYQGLSLADGKIEVYATDVKTELVQVFWSLEMDERISEAFENKLNEHKFKCNSFERKASIGKIEPETFADSILPFLLKLLN